MISKTMRLLVLVTLLLAFPLTGFLRAQDEMLLYDFERDVEGWQLVSAWAAGQAAEQSGANALHGSGALKLAATYTGEGWQEAGVSIVLVAPPDWSAWASLSMAVYAPPEATGFIAQIFLKTGDSWSWANTPDAPLTPGAWTTVTADLSTMGLVRDVREAGIKIGTSQTAFTGDFFLDAVTLSGQAGGITDGGVTPLVRAVRSVTPLQDPVGRYEKFEVVVDLDATFNNPYDPTDIRLDARFTSPSGRSMIVPGFYFRDFDFQLGATERLTATNDWSWRVRFTPTEIGDWTYQILATTQSGTVRSTTMNFHVTASDHHGFLRIDPRNPRYLAFDDGTPYFAIGENMSWYGSGGMADYTRWLDSLQAAGGNYIRVWLASWGFSFEWLDTGLGNYDRRQDRAYRLDKLFEMVAERDIYVMLCLLNHGAYSTTTDSEWDANPYNAANGGPLATPVEFATNAEAVRLWHQKLRYIAARWGYSTHILAWEWWNEVNWTPLASPDILAPWINRSAAYLRTLDPYDHLMTHSGSTADHTKVWENLSFTQDHLYNLRNLPREFKSTIAEWLQRYPDKPFLMGEFGSPPEFDTQGLLIHLGLWSPPMNGALGTGMTWWWDSYIHPQNLYYHFSGVAAYYAGEDLAAHQWQLTNATLSDGANAVVYGLQDPQSALLWVVSRNYSTTYLESEYTRNLRERAENPLDIVFPDITGVTITLEGLAHGTYTVEVWDTQTGGITATQRVATENGQIVVSLPTFNTDLALKVKAGWRS